MPRLRLSIPASLAAHKHKLAVTAASCTAVTGAVIGALAATAPDAHAATVPVAHSAAVHVVAHAAVSASAPASASASATPSAAATKASVSPSASATTSSAAPVVTKTTQKAVVAVTTQSNPYAGQSAYQIAEKLVPSSQFGCFDWVVTRESGWSVTATNPSSGAYGLGQALPGYKMASAGPDWQTNPVTQIKWVLGYMDGRYGSPCGAQSFWESHGWY